MWLSCTWGKQALRGKVTTPVSPRHKLELEPIFWLPFQPFHCAEQSCQWGYYIDMHWKPPAINPRTYLQRNRTEDVTEAGGQSHLRGSGGLGQSHCHPSLASCFSCPQPFGASLMPQTISTLGSMTMLHVIHSHPVSSFCETASKGHFYHKVSPYLHPFVHQRHWGINKWAHLISELCNYEELSSERAFSQGLLETIPSYKGVISVGKVWCHSRCLGGGGGREGFWDVSKDSQTLLFPG